MRHGLERLSRKRWRWAICAGVVGSVFLALTRWVFMPLHERGVGQEWLWPLNGVGNMMLLVSEPVRVIFLIGTRGHGGALAAVAADWITYCTVGAAAFWIWARLKAWSNRDAWSENGAEGGGPQLSRRQVLRMGTRLAAVGTATGFSYSLLVRPQWFVITRRRVAIRDLPAELEGLRIVHLTDLHHGPWTSLGHIQEVVRAANALHADLAVLTGDYVSRSSVYMEPVAQALGQLRAKIGVVGVLGNHDWWEGGPTMQREMARAGIPLIDNRRVMVTRGRRLVERDEEGLCIAGVGDFWADRQHYDEALGGLPAGMPRLLLSHNPDVAESRRFIGSGHRVDLMLSGHTHGGQIRVPLLGSAAPFASKHGEKYAYGLVRGPVCPVLVNAGTGVAGVPMRFGVSPEIVLLELKGEHT